jgi:hypothetical protein
LVKCTGKNKEHDLKDESLGRDSMNLLWKEAGKPAKFVPKHFLNSFQKSRVWLRPIKTMLYLLDFWCFTS